MTGNVATSSCWRALAVVLFPCMVSCTDTPFVLDAPSGDPGIIASVPEIIAQSRSIETDDLDLIVTINGVPVPSEPRGESWTASAPVTDGAPVRVTVLWSELFDGVPLPLATWSGLFESGERSALVGPDDYLSEYDDDGDGVSNLEERREGSDPRDSGDPVVPPRDIEPPVAPVAGSANDVNGASYRPPVEIPRNAVVPTIDGVWQTNEVWHDVIATVGKFDIDRLLIDRGNGVRAAGIGTARYWIATHDGEWLYLFVVRGIPADARLLLDSGEQFQDDNTVNLFFDGDASRTASLEGREAGQANAGDDVYVTVPLVPLDKETGVRPQAPRPRSPRVPLMDVAVCPCADEIGTYYVDVDSGWEMRISMADLGIEIDRPFGFEVQIDQDFDGGERDARWGWANPDVAVRRGDGNFPFESPAYNGTLVLRD